MDKRVWHKYPDEKPVVGDYYITVEDDEGNRWVHESCWLAGSFHYADQLSDYGKFRVLAWVEREPIPEPYMGE